MNAAIPELCLVVLVGASGSGKSSFAKAHFLPTEVLSSDFCRGLVSNDENDQAATNDAFAVLHYIAAKRLTRGLLTVIDATNVQREAREPLVKLAREHDVLPVAFVLDMPEELCHQRNLSRPDRSFGRHVIRQQCRQLRQSLRGLQREGFRQVCRVSSPEELAELTIQRQPLWNDRRADHGPFDIIGDVHGCFDELVELLTQMGYVVTPDGGSQSHGYCVTPPPGRKAVFLGDLVDRGPKVVPVLRLVMSMVQQGHALCVPGNHDVKLQRKLRGRDVQVTHGLDQTLREMDSEPQEFHAAVERFIDSLVSHYVLDGGRLVVAHAGMKHSYIGRASARVRDFALFGETTGESDEYGLPVRHNWAAEYRGPAAVVYGHTPVPEVDWLNGTLNIDTGCVFGGKLSALRWPERELLSVEAHAQYAVPAKPLDSVPADVLSAQQAHDDVLEIEDVIGKRIVGTRLHHNVTIREENAIAALEVMSRFAANPKWLIYLPPTMSPPTTTELPGLLEHPREAFDYFRTNGVAHVICEEKHMGSRAVVIVCRDEQTAARRFGIQGDGSGIIYTRTGRRFFDDGAVEGELIAHVQAALTHTGLWEELNSDWFCLDCELMPWSAKAQDLLKGQYAAIGAAGAHTLSDSIARLEQAAARYAALGEAEVSPLLERHKRRLAQVERYVAAYRHYCWPVRGLSDLRLAPFHLLAGEGKAYFDRDHLWHMQTLARLAEAGPPLLATPYHCVDVTDAASMDPGAAWWQDLTSRGGEGMVVKPLQFVARGPKGLVQPAIKCRGPDYLRIIYGPEYDTPEHLVRLRKRAVAAKRSLAAREFALGVESLERFVRREPLRRVHECVFGVLALESEPVDPRL